MERSIITEHENGVTLDLGNKLKVTYSHPMITPHGDESQEISGVNDFMYFYYDLEVKKGRKVVFRTSVHDHPIVDILSNLIDSIVNKRTAIMDTFEHYGTTYVDHFARIQKTNFLNQEYFAVLEKHIREEITGSETKSYTSYVLTFGEHPNMFTSFANKHLFSNDISFRELTEEQLLDFKALAERFIQFAIRQHNEQLSLEEN